MKYQTAALDWAAGMPPRAALHNVSKVVMGGTIVVLKGVFPESRMDACKAALLQWQSSVNESNPDRLNTPESWWRRDINPPSKTPHLFETICLRFPDDTPDGLADVQRIFAEMAALWGALTDQSATLDGRPGEGKKLRPQAIHYPRGGGYFDWHSHDLQPQRMGLILSLSKRGRDFRTGGTTFKDADGAVDTADVHDIGDICLFRYDLAHGVSVVDADHTLEWGPTGRWTMVLPLM